MSSATAATRTSRPSCRGDGNDGNAGGQRILTLSLGGGRILTLSLRHAAAAAAAGAVMGTVPLPTLGMGSEEVVKKHCISVSAAYKSQNVCLDENG